MSRRPKSKQKAACSYFGMAYVAEHEGLVTFEDAENILHKARLQGEDCDKRILIKGKAEVTLDSAQQNKIY